MKISVIVCTRNPRQEYLRRVLSALAEQTLPSQNWELILVDNGSKHPLQVNADNGRVVVEPQPGLTNARLKGIAEARGEWLVFVDDDNVLSPDYLEAASRICSGFPQLGAIGGRTTPEFETEPPPWLGPFYPHLAIITVDEDRWSNRKDFGVFPCGAGLCIRRELAVAYANEVALDERRRKLDRTEQSLISCGDTDMVISCIRKGFGVGRFKALHLTHLIPRQRLDYAYNKRLAYGIGYSVGVLRALEGPVSFGVKAKAFVRMCLTPLITDKSGRAKWIEWSNSYGFWQGLRRGRV